jgi:hypothetical protein
MELHVFETATDHLPNGLKPETKTYMNTYIARQTQRLRRFGFYIRTPGILVLLCTWSRALKYNDVQFSELKLCLSLSDGDYIGHVFAIRFFYIKNMHTMSRRCTSTQSSDKMRSLKGPTSGVPLLYKKPMADK